MTLLKYRLRVHTYAAKSLYCFWIFLTRTTTRGGADTSTDTDYEVLMFFFLHDTHRTRGGVKNCILYHSTLYGSTVTGTWKSACAICGYRVHEGDDDSGSY